VREKVRGWHLIAALITITVIGVVIALRWKAGGPRDITGMAAYLPKREAVLAYVDVAAIRNSGLLEKLLGSTVGEEVEYKTFLERTGFNYKRDLDQVLISSASGVHYLLLRGRFDWDKLRAYAAQQGGACDSGYCSVSGSTAGRVISFYPVTDDLMALASAATEKAARDITRRPAEKLSFDVPAKPVWLHASAVMLRDQPQAPPGTRLFLKALEQAEQLIITIGPSGDAFEVAMNVTCKTEQDAAVLKAQLEGITSLLSNLILREKQTPNPSDLSGVLTSGVFQRDLRQVIGRWPIQKSFLESLSSK
jgi:hypothetical protein